MNFILEKSYLDINIKLNKTSIEIEEEEREDMKIDFKELRKKTSGELFDISFWEDKLVIKEKDWSILPMAMSFFNDELETTLVLKIPKNISVEGNIVTVNGDIDINAIKLDGKLKTVNGDIQIGYIQCNTLKIDCISGDTRIEKVNGFIKSKGVSGRFLIEKGHLKGFSHKGVSGDIYINADFELEDDIQINSVSGDIYLNVHSYHNDRHIYITSLSSDTDIKGTFPKDKIHIKKKMPTIKSFPFKDFMPMIKDVFSGFNTYKDDIDGEPNAEKQEPKSEKHQNEVAMILKMVSDGKINIDEAERLIKALK
ncbi:MAG: DUF4097 family beta strand repeat protein [Deltaproteobacteria bacterium]|nr:DUF4097 family beta strand repeat protein [Deltaproteobacteria bacterium]